MVQNWVRWSSAMSPHPFLRFMSNRQNPRPVTPVQEHRGPSHAAAGRSEEFSIVENLVLKIIHKSTHLIISKRKLKNAQGQSMNRKGGLSSPNKLFADWIIHGESRMHLEGFDSVCQTSLESEATSETLHFLRYHFSVLPQQNFHLEPDVWFTFLVPDTSQYLMLEGKPQEKSWNWFILSLSNMKLLALGRNRNKGFFITVFPTWQIFPHVWTFIMWAEICSLL